MKQSDYLTLTKKIAEYSDPGYYSLVAHQFYSNLKEAFADAVTNPGASLTDQQMVEGLQLVHVEKIDAMFYPDDFFDENEQLLISNSTLFLQYLAKACDEFNRTMEECPTVFMATKKRVVLQQRGDE